MAAYVLAQIDVHDPQGFERYREKVSSVVAAFGGRYLARGGETIPLEGKLEAPRVVIIEFEDLEAARRWYFSDAYQEIVALRLEASSGSATIINGI